MRKFVFLLIILQGGLLVPAALQAQLNIRRIKFEINDIQGKGIGGVTISITSPERSKFSVTETTNKKGKAMVSLLGETKTIHIALEKEGYQPLTTRNPITPPLGTSERSFVLYRTDELTPEQKRAAAESQAMASQTFTKGLEFFEAGDMRACIEAFNAALEYRPDWIEAQQNLAAAHFRLQEYEKAIDYAKRSLALDPSLSQSLRLLSVAYSKLGDEKTARMYEEQLGNLEGVQIPAEEYFNMGAVAANEKDDEKALGFFLKAVELKPEFADGKYQLALCYIRLGKHAEAIPVLNQFLELEPEGQKADNARLLVKAFSNP